MLKIKVNGKTDFEYDKVDNVSYLNKVISPIDLQQIDKSTYQIIRNGKCYLVEILNTEPKELVLRINGQVINLDVKNKLDLLLEKLGIDAGTSGKLADLKAPMPGLILDILVKEGDSVKKGDILMILEAMKMENVIKAQADCTIKSIKAEKRTTVEKNKVLIEFS